MATKDNPNGRVYRDLSRMRSVVEKFGVESHSYFGEFSPVHTLRSLLSVFDHMLSGMLIQEVLNGNFEALVLDDRIVLGDLKRERARKELDRIRVKMIKSRAAGKTVDDILFRPKYSIVINEGDYDQTTDKRRSSKNRA